MCALKCSDNRKKLKASKSNTPDISLESVSSFDNKAFQWLDADVNNEIFFANDSLKAIILSTPEFDELTLKNLNNIFK
jgi:hypothetical protein